jgi:dipeptidyl aminopeptidase/acylaminoacyl peptidase
MHFLHGISPDGGRLAYVRLDPDGDNWWASATVHTVGVDGRDDVAVTTDPDPADGCEWTPDGEWIVFNTTINVPSWAPDGHAFAFVDYPLD